MQYCHKLFKSYVTDRLLTVKSNTILSIPMHACNLYSMEIDMSSYNYDQFNNPIKRRLAWSDYINANIRQMHVAKKTVQYSSFHFRCPYVYEELRHPQGF